MNEMAMDGATAESVSVAEPASLVTEVRKLAAQAGNRTAYTYVDYSADLTGWGSRRTMTWAEVDRGARAVAAALRRRVAPGERAAVLAPQGLEYVVAMLGAFYARVVAVPLFTPDLPGHGGRLRRIIDDADPACVLTTAATAGQVSRFLEEDATQQPGLVIIDLNGRADCPDELPGPDDVAYLQYTSGSTRAPEGVMITHRCVAANAAQIITGLGVRAGQATAVSWLPLFHDMGLVLTVAMPIATTGQALFMDPAAFLMRPVRWLQLVSERPDAYTAGPNFAYEYCAARIDEAAKTDLDLSGARAFLNGAEPVRPATLRGFARAFESCGLDPAALTPAYGLAEATVYVTSGRPGQPAVITAFSRRELERGAAVTVAEDDPGAITLASCGQPAGQHLAVVDPRTSAPCPSGLVGEIWVNGPNVAPGYFRQQPHDTQTFGAALRVSPDGLPRAGWLRTGDLGMIHDGELFVTGRLRDLIIVDGRNHYPQDVEMTVQDAHPAIRPDRVAAFSVDTEGGEHLVVVAEGARHGTADQVEVTRAVRTAVTVNHGIRLHDFLFVRPGAVPRTSSGKIARSACRERYLAGSFGG